MDTIAALLPTDLSVESGSRVTATIRVRNTGSIVDRFDIDVVGVTGWVRVDPPSLSLFPGAEESATITFAPPRASVPRAGIYPFGVRVRPDANPAASTVEEGRITVIPFVAITAEIAPQTSRASRAGHHQVVVENRGNAPADVVVTAVDPDRRLAIGVEPGRAIVGPDDGAGFGVRVQVDDPFPFGPSRPRPFVTTVQALDQAPIQLGATLSQQALLPGWIPRAAAIAVALVAVVGGAFFFRLGPFAPAPAPTPPIVLVTQPPVVTPTEPPAEEPVVTAEPAQSVAVETPSESPTPAPLKPKDFTLAVTGDAGELGPNIQLICPATDKACRRSVKETILLMAQELQNPYTGTGITSTSSPNEPNSLPVQMSAEREFPWGQAGEGDEGVTMSVVVDLGPLLANPQGYVYAVVNTPEGIPHRYVVDAGLAKQLFDKLYLLPPEVPPVAPVTPPPDLTIIDTVFAQPVWDQQWLLFQPVFSPNP